MAVDLTPQLTALLAAKGLHPTQSWLTSLLSQSQNQSRTPPIQALLSTATFRLYASDITATLRQPPHAVLPADIQSSQIKERRLPFQLDVRDPAKSLGAVIVQVLDVEDLGRSRWSQVEDLEALARGEGTRGREIIRVNVPGEGEDAGPTAAAGRSAVGGNATAAAANGLAERASGPHKLLLQDVKGQVVYGFEVKGVDGIRVGMGIGAKLWLKGCLVGRGMVMLEPGTVTLLGGKNEAAHTQWVKTRIDNLKAKVQQGRAGDAN